MELFFPDVAERLDFRCTRMLDRELFTDIPEGARREPDILIEAHTATGDIELILVHIEVQAKRENDVPYRMWEYYSLLRLRRKRPVFPLAVYLSPGSGGLTEESYSEMLFERDILKFRYAVVGLPDLHADRYLDSDNILAAALSALMRSETTPRIVRKFRAYQRLAQAPLDDARRSLLVMIVDRYLRLSRAEEAELSRRLAQPDSKEVAEMLTSYEQRGIKQGKRETLLRLMTRKFGTLPEETVQKVEKIQSVRKLDALLDRILDAQTLEERGLSE